MDGALIINKHAGVSSFGIIEILQRQLVEKYGWKRKDFPKMGHGGTLDPFATGLLIVCIGRAAKLSRYFLGSSKAYEGVMRFGETTVPGDPTAPISEVSDVIPESIEAIQALAHKLCAQPYYQTPPMYSAKKKDGKPLYELARQGIEVDREPKLCRLYSFEVLSYEKPRMKFRISCSSGTYIRTLTQDFGRMLGSVALLETLHRTASGSFRVEQAFSTDQIGNASKTLEWDDLPCWTPFDQLLGGFASAQATPEEAQALSQGRQNVLLQIVQRSRVLATPDPVDPHLAIYEKERLVGVAKRNELGIWEIERIFAVD